MLLGFVQEAVSADPFLSRNDGCCLGGGKLTTATGSSCADVVEEALVFLACL
jgi:hypothetical protein